MALIESETSIKYHASGSDSRHPDDSASHCSGSGLNSKRRTEAISISATTWRHWNL